jgi:hypothetical protein
MMLSDFTMFVAGDTGALKEAFARRPRYRLPSERQLDARTPNGFEAAATAGAFEFWPSTVGAPSPPLRFATDAWPFLYLRSPMIPALSLRGIAIMGGIGLAFLLPFVRPRAGAAGVGWQMLWLGAGFMLIETKAVGLPLTRREHRYADRPVPRPRACAADRGVVPAGVHADLLRGSDLRDVVRCGRGCRPRLRLQYCRGARRRTGREQLDAAGVSIYRGGRDGVLCGVVAEPSETFELTKH